MSLLISVFRPTGNSAGDGAAAAAGKILADLSAGPGPSASSAATAAPPPPPLSLPSSLPRDVLLSEVGDAFGRAGAAESRH